jgi:hypothetical protein
MPRHDMANTTTGPEKGFERLAATPPGSATSRRHGHTLVAVDIMDEPDRDSDGDRTVDFESEEAPLLADQTRDDTERGWGEQGDANDDRLLDDRPPHWD